MLKEPGCLDYIRRRYRARLLVDFALRHRKFAMHYESHRILVVDDDFDERFLTQRALRKSLTERSTINLVSGGDEAIAYMMGKGEFADRKKYPFPTLVITDIHMNEGDGFDVLEFIQSKAGWHVVPRVVFSSSDDPDDVRTAYALGASVFHLKPSSSGELEKRMRALLEYWSSAEIPPVDENGRALFTHSISRGGARYRQLTGMRMNRSRKSEAKASTHAVRAGR